MSTYKGIDWHLQKDPFGSDRSGTLSVVNLELGPVAQGKNVLYATVQNNSDQEQVFAIHIYTRSPDYGPEGVGWGRPFFDTLKANETRRLRFVYNIQGPVTEKTYVRVKYYNPASQAEYDYEKPFAERRFQSDSLQRQTSEKKDAAAEQITKAVTETFTEFRQAIREKNYDKAWAMLTRDHQEVQYHSNDLERFKKQMEPTHPLDSGFVWEKADLLELKPTQVYQSDGSVQLEATTEGQTWTIHFVQEDNRWKIDWIGGYTPAVVKPKANPGDEPEADNANSSNTSAVNTETSTQNENMLSGTVVDSGGNPAAGVLVLPMPHGGDPLITDAQGRFDLPGPSQDPDIDRRIDFLLIRSPQTNEAAVAYLGSLVNPIRIQLQPALTLFGRVTDSAGRPIVGAKVIPSVHHDWKAGFGNTAFERTTINGTFEIRGLPVELEYSLCAAAPGHSSYEERLGQFAHPGRIEIDTIVLNGSDTGESGGSSGGGVSGTKTASGQSGPRAETDALQEFWLELSVFGKTYADKAVIKEYSDALDNLELKDALKPNEKGITSLILSTEQADDFRQWIGAKGGIATLHLPKLNLTNNEETQISLQDSQEYITGYKGDTPEKDNVLLGIQLALTPEVLSEDKDTLRLNLKYVNNILLNVVKETDAQGREIQVPTTRMSSIEAKYAVPFDQVLLAPGVFDSETKSSSQIIFFLMKITRKNPAANSSSENNSKIYTVGGFAGRLNQMSPEEHVSAGMDAFSIDPSPKKQTENAPAQSKNDTLLLGPNGTGYFDRNTPIQIGSIVLKVARRIEAKNVGTDIVEIKSDNTERKLLLGLGGTGYFDRNAAIQIGDAWVKVDRRIEVTNTGSGTIEIISTKGQQAANRKSKEATAALYDVADLMRPSPDEDYQPGGVRVNDAIERLIKEIESIEPESWRAKGGPGQINAHGSTRLIIRQTPDMHEKIAEYLARRRIQVVIEARFLLLEELFEGRSGIDEDSERRGQVIEGYANSDEIKAAMETKPLRERNLPTIEHKPPQKVDSETEQSIIRAAQQFKNSRVLTAPKAMVLNHESASMRVGRSHSYVDAAEETKEIDQGVVLDLLPVVQDDNKTILLKTHIQMTDVLEKRTQVIDGKEYKIPWVQVTTIPFQARVESGGTILVEGPEVSVKNDKTGELEKQRLYVLLKPTALAAPENK